MKTAVALACAISVALSAVPISAQDKIVMTPGPIARAAAREAGRLRPEHQIVSPADSGWARVRRLASGTAVTLTVRGLQPGARHVVRATENDLTVLNLTNPAVTPAAKSVLLEVAAYHPDDFAAARTGNTFLVQRDVRMGPDGVFVANRKVADLGQVVESIMRADVLEITSPGRTRGSVVGAIAGAAGGLLLGRFFAGQLVYKPCGGGCGYEKALIGLSLVGLPIAGGVLGYGAAGRKTAHLVYRAP